MKGKSNFTLSEAKLIISLIEQKLRASRNEQKSIRDRIRSIGFYYTDFSGSKHGYTVEDFLTLARNGEITITGGGQLVGAANSNNVKFVSKDYYGGSTVVNEKTKQISIVDELSFKLFDPLVSSKLTLLDSPGIYIICLRKDSKLPETLVKPVFAQYKNLDVIYIGISERSIQIRDFKQHFNGNNAGRSTLRKSLGVLFGYKLVPRDKDPETGKTKFYEIDEISLTNWMSKNLLFYHAITMTPSNFEEILISQYDPPLNLSKVKYSVNTEFRKWISSMRNPKH